MPIIIISADARETEEGIAEKVAEAMGYTLLSPEIMAEIGTKNHLDPEQLCNELEATPHLFQKLLSCQWRHDLACIEGEVLERMLADNIVCQGLCAHLYVLGVSHAMKVRILSGDDRAAANQGLLEKTKRDRVVQCRQRKKWSMAAYGNDETDLSRYDLVINLGQIDPDEAVKTITHAAAFRKFQVMTYSIKCLANLALSARVTAVLLETMSDIRVESNDGSVVIFGKASNRNKLSKITKIKELAGKVKGVNFVEVHVKRNINPIS
ncbi:MAG: cytidylate kinase-like family protein [Desulforhopalus sp.]|nr:cytidylate kinase-like family protein [Desulforhopalus sp.]